MTFDLEAARNAGYSDKEIKNYLDSSKSKKPNFDFEGARNAGYSDKEIQKFLYKPKSTIDQQIEERKEMYDRFSGEPKSKFLGLLRGAGNIAGEISGGDVSPLAKRKKSLEKRIGLPGESSKQKEVREKFEEIGEGLTSFGIPLPPIIEILKPLSNSKWAQTFLKLFEKGSPTPKNLKKLEKSAQSISNFRERDAVMRSLNEAKNAKSLEEIPSLYDLAEASLEKIKPEFPKVQPERKLGLEVPISRKEGGSPLRGRVTEAPGPGTSISPVEFESNAQGGRALNNATRNYATEQRELVTQAYNEARQNYQNINSIGDQFLIDDLNREIARLRESFGPNTAESTVLNRLEAIRDFYLTRNGVEVSRLIKTSDSLSGMANYELPFTGPKDILKNAANILDRAAIRAIENNGGNAELLRNANRMYGNWAERFGNDEISPFLKRRINNPEKIFDSVVKDPGTFRAVENALEGSPRSQEFLNALAREVAENEMKNFIGKNLDKVGSRAYLKDLRNLRDLIGEQRTLSFDRALRRQRTLSLKERVPGEVLTPTTKSLPDSQRILDRISKNQKMSPEDLLKKLDSRSGIKELKKLLPKNEFEKLLESKLISTLREGKITSKPSGKDLFDILNKEKNFEIFSEILGKEETRNLLKLFEKIKDREITNENIIRVAKILGLKALPSIAAWKFIKTLIKVLV